MSQNAFSLESLERIIAARAQVSDGSSYTEKLVKGGPAYIGKKLGEEAVECVIAGLIQDEKALTGEAADLLYHLLVLLYARKIPVQTVLDELARRTGQSGLAEKASRAQ